MRKWATNQSISRPATSSPLIQHCNMSCAPQYLCDIIELKWTNIKKVNNHLNCNTDHFECVTNEFRTPCTRSMIHFDSCTNYDCLCRLLVGCSIKNAMSWLCLPTHNGTNDVMLKSCSAEGFICNRKSKRNWQIKQVAANKPLITPKNNAEHNATTSIKWKNQKIINQMSSSHQCPRSIDSFYLYGFKYMIDTLTTHQF